MRWTRVMLSVNEDPENRGAGRLGQGVRGSAPDDTRPSGPR